MKKNIVIIVLILVTASNIFYAYIKANDAERSSGLAVQYQKEAEMLQDEARSLQEKAQVAAAEAMRQRERTRQALLDCKNK